MPLKIEDYAIIGDTHTAALVGKDGSIDWLCVPRFDSGACFAALLGSPANGRWSIAPRGDAGRVARHYESDTLVLVTEWTTAGGVVEVRDFMPISAKNPAVMRVVRGVRGRVDMSMELIIRFDYGSSVPWVSRQEGAVRAIVGPDALWLRADVKTEGRDFTTQASFSVEEGQVVRFSLGWYPSHQGLPPPVDVDAHLAQTMAWWREWASQCVYRGEWRDDVVRSLVTLKALTYEPTGGIVAAPTMGLPEKIGGVRNWDYRYCWIRDATFTLYSLLLSGYRDEAIAWRDWLVRAVAGDPSQLQIVYGPAGERNLWEIEIPWLPGYEASSPVRIGNLAVRQFQLDVYGEMLDAMYQARRIGVGGDGQAWALELELMKFLESGWQKPDSGLWEMRGPPRHFTHSKLMAWVGVDRVIKSARQFEDRGPIERWSKLGDRIKAEICERGYDPSRQTFTQYYGSRQLDASLLMMAQVGFLPPTDERIRGTVAAIERELLRDGLVLRYSEDSEHVDGLPPGEGVFLACSYWLADNYALMGRAAEGRRLFEMLLGLRNDVGLLSEEYDPVARRMLGNFPQAFSHVGLINTAHNLSEALSPAEHRQG
jgi:GH15 family glucan-1,4-alpha-glucosidase